MKRYFSALAGTTFDLIVIGGGIIGTGIARDAALRGLSTLLVEKEDFACGTTSRSSRLVHGGLRYLRMLEFGLVRQDLREREILLKIAPHLVHRLKFVIPLLRSEPLYRFSLPFGLRLYDILATDKSLPPWQHLSRRDTLDLEPSLSDTGGLTGSCLYYDCQSEFMERLCLENALDAARNGACILNHTTMTDFLTADGTVSGIHLKDMLSGADYQARGRVVINAGGPWTDTIWNKLNINKSAGLRKTKGIHLVTRQISKNALVLFAKSDGRLFFVIPWEGYSLIGTTDTDYAGDLDNVQAESSDVNYLISEIRHCFPGFRQEDVYYTMAGLRPLVAADKKAESNTSRAHKLIDHEKKDGIKGFISILGGKITAYRAVAEEAVDLICRKLGRQVRCITASTPLPGAPVPQMTTIENAARSNGLPVATVTHLAGIYGSRFSEVLDYVRADNRLGNPVASSCRDILAQIKHSVDEEEVLTPGDFLLRRSAIGLESSQGLDAVETVAQEMATLLGWSDQERQDQIAAYRISANLGRHFTE